MNTPFKQNSLNESTPSSSPRKNHQTVTNRRKKNSTILNWRKWRIKMVQKMRRTGTSHWLIFSNNQRRRKRQNCSQQKFLLVFLISLSMVWDISKIMNSTYDWFDNIYFLRSLISLAMYSTLYWMYLKHCRLNGYSIRDSSIAERLLYHYQVILPYLTIQFWYLGCCHCPWFWGG